MKFKIIPNEQTPEADYNISIEDIIKNHSKLLEKFLSFSMRQKNCAGLASTQVSCDGERIMIPFFSIKEKYSWDIIILPEIVEYIGKPTEQIEGCLTWLGKKIIADRYFSIRISYYTLKGEKKEEMWTGYKAQIAQHEYNHLKGIEEVIL